MRKPENREKFKAGIAALARFYGVRDAVMVCEVLEEEAKKAKELEARRELRRMRMRAEEQLDKSDRLDESNL